MRVAVLGAGIQGACTSLELALNGVEVDLYDKNGRPLAGTSSHNEGKIHLGYVYANVLETVLEAVAHQEQALTAGPVKTSSEQLESVSDA
jgi:glycine/D-amino acid oxidase-like deaminating enzyme